MLSSELPVSEDIASSNVHESSLSFPFASPSFVSLVFVMCERRASVSRSRCLEVSRNCAAVAIPSRIDRITTIVRRRTIVSRLL